MFFDKDLISILYKHSPLMSMQLFSTDKLIITYKMIQKKKSHVLCGLCIEAFK